MGECLCVVFSSSRMVGSGICEFGRFRRVVERIRWLFGKGQVVVDGMTLLAVRRLDHRDLRQRQWVREGVWCAVLIGVSAHAALAQARLSVLGCDLSRPSQTNSGIWYNLGLRRRCLDNVTPFIAENGLYLLSCLRGGVSAQPRRGLHCRRVSTPATDM